MTSRSSSGRTSPDEFIERLKELVAANAAGSRQLVNRFSDLVREASRAMGGGHGGGRTDTEALLSRWLDFNLASYSVVSSHSLSLLNGLLSAASDSLIPKTPAAADAKGTPAQQVELRLSGRHGERATTGFVIENHFDRELAVTFESTELVPKAGASLPASLISFEPTTLVLEPRGQGVVRASVVITTEFEVSETYTAAIRLLGFEAKQVRLSVTVLPPAGPAAPAREPKPPKSAPKRPSRGAK